MIKVPYNLRNHYIPSNFCKTIIDNVKKST